MSVLLSSIAWADVIEGTWTVTNSHNPPLGSTTVTISAPETAGLFIYESCEDSGIMRKGIGLNYAFTSTAGGGTGIVQGPQQRGGSWAWQNVSTGQGGTMAKQ